MKTKARLGCEGPCERVKGKLEVWDTTDRLGGEVQVESLAPIDQGNKEDQARVRSMDIKAI